MSKEHAKNFHEKLEGDPELRRKVREISGGAAEKVLELAKQHGFHFSHDDLRKVLYEKWGGNLAKKSDQEDPDTCVLISERPEF